MVQKVFRYVEQYQMLEPQDAVVAGVSGGADSVCLLFLLSKPLVEVSSQVLRLSASSGRVVHCPFRKKNHEQPKLYQLTLFVFCIFQCFVLKNQGGEMVVAIQSKGENWFWNWGTLLQVRASVLNMYKQLPRM